MTPTWKILLGVLLSLSIPLLLTMVWGPRVASSPRFERSGTSALTESAASVQPGEDTAVRDVSEQGSSYAVITSDAHLDPVDEKTFVVSVQFRIDDLPPLNTRTKIVSKYDSGMAPYPGWAIAIVRQMTSTRPAVYWQSAKGKTDWYYFDDLAIIPGATYALTVVVRPNRSLALYGGRVIQIEPGTDGSPSQSEHVAGKELRFLGAYELQPGEVPSSKANLYFGARGAQKSFFQGNVTQLLIAVGSELPKKHSLNTELFTQSPGEIRSRLPERDIALYVSGNGDDESQYSRKILYRDNT